MRNTAPAKSQNNIGGKEPAKSLHKHSTTMVGNVSCQDDIVNKTRRRLGCNTNYDATTMSVAKMTSKQLKHIMSILNSSKQLMHIMSSTNYNANLMLNPNDSSTSCFSDALRSQPSTEKSCVSWGCFMFHQNTDVLFTCSSAFCMFYHRGACSLHASLRCVSQGAKFPWHHVTFERFLA